MNDQENINKEYLSVLKQVYAQIDNKTNLLWNERDEASFIQSRGSKNTRSRLSDKRNAD